MTSGIQRIENTRSLDDTRIPLVFPFLLRRRACFYKIREDTLIASRGRRRVKANKKMAEELVITRRQSLERASNRAVLSLHKVRNVLATFDTNISRDTCLFSKERIFDREQRRETA